MGGFGIRAGRTIGVYWIGTVPEARGRGFGAAINRRILADGAAAGCDVGTLEASAMGQAVYERIEFRIVVGYDVSLDPALHRLIVPGRVALAGPGRNGGPLGYAPTIGASRRELATA